jgi:hypothetical protein
MQLILGRADVRSPTRELGGNPEGTRGSDLGIACLGESSALSAVGGRSSNSAMALRY